VKRVLAAVSLALLALLALAAVLVVRTVQVPAPEGPATASAPVAVDAALAAERLAEAVRIPTISYGSGAPVDTAAFLAFHDLLARSFSQAHAAMQREVIGGLSLLYTWPGADAALEPVVLMGHMDVVPVTDENLPEWTHPPFAGVVADGFVWGRGTLDDKTTVLSTLEAIEGLVREGFVPARTVYLTFGHDEEVGGRFGARPTVDELVRRGVRPAMVLDEGGFMTSGAIPGVEGRAAIVGIAEKGYLSLRLRAQAQGGHSSMPTGRTAVGALSRAVATIEANPFPGSLDGPTSGMLEAMAPYAPFGQRVALANLWLTEPLVLRTLARTPLGAALTRTTIAPTILSAGIKDNVLPPEATAVVNFRIRPGETQTSVIARVTELVSDTLIRLEPTDSARTDPSPVSDVASPAYRLIAATIRGMAPGESLPVLPYLVMGGTDAKYWGPHSARVFRFLAVPLGDGDVARIHGVNERIAVEDYAVAVGFFSRLLRGLDQLE
jgi:carboxypeptidase PM20D1